MGKWWNGNNSGNPNTFNANSETFNLASGTTLWSLLIDSGNLKPGDSFTIHARATDNAGNVEAGPTVSFTFNTSVAIVANDAAASETATNNGQFTVSLTQVSSTDTVVSYAVAGTAAATTDYTALTGSVTILAGNFSALINVSGIVDDAIVEADETVVVTLTSVSGDPQISLDPVAANKTATVTIADNDSATVTLSGTTTAVEGGTTEGGTTGALTATLSLQTSGTGTASLATAITGITLASNADYSSNSQAFGIGAVDGATVSLTVRATDDQLVEGPESFAAAALVDTTSNAAVTESGTGTVNVSDNDSATIAFLVASSTVGEAAAMQDVTAVLTITASGTGTVQLAREVTVNVTDAGGGTATGGGTDYTATTKMLTFGVGSLTGQTQTTSGLLTIVDDKLLEGSETVNLTLGGLSDGTGGQVTLVAPTSHVVTL